MLAILPASRAALEPPAIERRAAEVAQRVRSRAAGARREPAVLFVPGRVEVIGKHTDYAGGESLTCATERGICVAAAGRGDRRLRIEDLGRGLRAELDLDRLDGGESGGWTRIPRAVCRRLLADFGGGLAGADVAFSSDLPPAAGMSSSSALLTALFLALAAANRLSPDCLRSLAPGPEAEPRQLLAAYLAAVERGAPFDPGRAGVGAEKQGVGTLGGSEDHTAILCSERGALGLFRYLPTKRLATTVLPAGWTLGIAASGVQAAKAGAERQAFNRLSRLATAAADLWRLASGRRDAHLAAAVAAAGAAEVRAALALHAHAEFSTEELLERFDQFAEENEILVPRAAAALAAADLEGLSRAVGRSQRLAEEKLHNQVPETSFLARRAVELGAAAASAFGAGFGGSVWALMRVDDGERFLSAWRAAYLERFPGRAAAASFFASPPAAPARRLPSQGS